MSDCKAYVCSNEFYEALIYAPTRGAANNIMAKEFDDDFIHIRSRRLPHMDSAAKTKQLVEYVEKDRDFDFNSLDPLAEDKRQQAQKDWENQGEITIQGVKYECVSLELMRKLLRQVGCNINMQEPTYIYSGQWELFWRESGGGYTKNKDEAGPITSQAAYERSSGCGPEKKILYVYPKKESTND